jgi:hypothetical protein
VSIYERLQKLSCEKHMLTREFVMHPLICKFTNDQFYNVKFHNRPNVQSVEYNQTFESLKFPIYIYNFMDIPSMELVHSTKWRYQFSCNIWHTKIFFCTYASFAFISHSTNILVDLSLKC